MTLRRRVPTTDRQALAFVRHYRAKAAEQERLDKLDRAGRELTATEIQAATLQRYPGEWDQDEGLLDGPDA